MLKLPSQEMADLHPRVEQLRLEAGVPSKPESDAHRDARLNTLQLVRSFIFSDYFPLQAVNA